MNNCDDLRLYEFFSGRLDGHESEQIASHLDSCWICSERLHVMAALQSDYASKPPRRFGSQLWAAAIAAGLLTIVALVPALMNTYTPVSWGDLSANAPYPYFPVEARSEEPPNQMGHMMTAYHAGDYSEALVLLQTLPESQEGAFFIGVCLYMTGEFKDSRRVLDKVASDSERWRNPALWYLASCDLNMDLPHSALSRLKLLTENPGEFRLEARELIPKIRARLNAGKEQIDESSSD